MISRRAMVIGLAVLVCLALGLGLALSLDDLPARSEGPPSKPSEPHEPPDDVTGTITEAAERCRADGGKPDTAGVLRVDDLNGDGNNDLIVDFAKLKCDGAENAACNPDGCMLQLYFGAGEGWDQVFQDFVKSFKFSTSGNTRIMHVTTSGIPCNKPVKETCLYNYRLDKDAVTPMK